VILWLPILAVIATAMPQAQDKPWADRQKSFLEILKQGKFNEAYTDVTAGSLIEKTSDDYANLVEQTTKGIEHQRSSLARKTYLSRRPSRKL